MLEDRAALALAVAIWTTLFIVIAAIVRLRRGEWRDLHS
jgi:hypothetical protein